MALYIAKPIMWNQNRYKRPSGVKVAAASFPGKYGFGHEEWNAAKALAFKDDGVAHRTFHTESVGNAAVDEEAGSIVVFMYASHDGVQELVGVAGSASCLIDDQPQREALAERLKLGRLGEQAWAVPRVRELHRNSRPDFDDVWRSDVHWIPNWRCPADTFLWLDKPALLDPIAIRGTGKLLTMFGRHTELDRGQALTMLHAVPESGRVAQWHRIHAEIDAEDRSSIDDDLKTLRNQKGLNLTTRKQLIDARIGQGKFRSDVARLWDKARAVSGCSLSEALRASHIVPWKNSDEEERLDGQNGLFLTAELDALFDRGLISFGNDGQMIIAARLRRADRKLFQLPRPLRKTPTKRQRQYLARHRQFWTLEV